MIKGLAAAPGGLHSDSEHLLEFTLADVISQATGAEGVVAGAILAGFLIVFRAGLGINQG